MSPLRNPQPNSPCVILRHVDTQLAASLCGRSPFDGEKAPDFPRDDDLVICALIADGVVAADPPWCAYAVLADHVIVGTAGFKGAPADGSVEIGYGIVPSMQRQGLGSRAVRLLLDMARQQGAGRVIAETEPDSVASRALLRSMGFDPIDERWWELLV